MSINRILNGNGADTVNKRISMPLCEKKLALELSNDYTLPDYQQEIRRILHVNATVTYPTKYISAAGGEFTGVVDYTLLYVGSDGLIYTAPLVAEYSINVPVENDSKFDFNEGIVSCCDINSENISARLSGMRKVNIKCRLNAHIRSYAVMIMDEKLSGDVNEDCIQALNICRDCTTVLRQTSEAIELSEEILTDTQNCRIAGACGEVFVSDISSSEGSVNARGEVYLKLIFSDDEDRGNTSRIIRRIPFNETVNIEDMSADCSCCASGIINDISINAEEQRIICDVNIMLDIESQKSTSFTYVKDIYSIENESQNIFRDYKIPMCGFCHNGNFSVNERIAKENLSIPDKAEIIDIYASAYAEDFEIVGEKCLVTAQIKYSLVLSEEGEYSCMDITLPAKYEFDCKAENISSGDFNMNVFSCRVRQDGEYISIDSEVGICAKGISAEEIVALNEVIFKDRIKKNKSLITVCYPAPDDTLWSVAKKYHIPTSRIEILNGVEEKIDGREYLIV